MRPMNRSGQPGRGETTTTKLLEDLAAAVTKFWKHYDPDSTDPAKSKAPTNDEVRDWLFEKRGVAKGWAMRWRKSSASTACTLVWSDHASPCAPNALQGTPIRWSRGSGCEVGGVGHRPLSPRRSPRPLYVRTRLVQCSVCNFGYRVRRVYAILERWH